MRGGNNGILSITLDFISNLRLKNYIASDVDNIIYSDIGKYELKSGKELIKGMISSLILLPFGLNLLFSGLEFYGSTRDDILKKSSKQKSLELCFKKIYKNVRTATRT